MLPLRGGSMLAVMGGHNASQCATELCCAGRRLSHMRPQKSQWGRWAYATRQAPHMTRSSHLPGRDQPCRQPQPQMTLPAVQSGTHPSSPADSSTQDTSPQNRPPRVEILHCDHAASY
jgi:hypothetical protein